MTLRQHLLAEAKASGELHPRLSERPALPAHCDDAWRAFLRLHATRQSGMGPGAISYTEIAAYRRDNPLSAWEVDAIRAADRAYFEVRAE